MSTPTRTRRWNTARIRACKHQEKIVSLTAYDYTTAKLVDEAGIHLIIVGDSLGMTMLGYSSTIPVTLEAMIHHTRAVARGASHALVVADMPFLSYQVSIEKAVYNAGRLLQEARADSVKIEGGALRAPTVKALVNNGIPVMGHIGLTPQSVKEFGGYKIQGRSEERAAELRDDAAALEEAGCFALVLEGMPAELAGEITTALSIPTIGIGAGPECDGQVLVVQDMLGMYRDFRPRFVKAYAELGDAMLDAFRAYAQEVQDGDYPGPEHCY